MKKKFNPLSILIAIVVFSFCIISLYFIFRYIIFISGVDVTYIEKLEKAFQEYNIDDLDSLLNDDTEICCGDNTAYYIDCKKNILNNMQKKSYVLKGMYGGGNNIFINGIQEIGTQFYCTMDEIDYGESYVVVHLKQNKVDNYKIVKLESDDEVLEKLFY